MLFEQDGTLLPQDKVGLLFRVEKGTYPVMARAVVVWVDDKRLAGVRYIAMSDHDRGRIRKRIAAEVAKPRAGSGSEGRQHGHCNLSTSLL